MNDIEPSKYDVTILSLCYEFKANGDERALVIICPKMMSSRNIIIAFTVLVFIIRSNATESYILWSARKLYGISPKVYNCPRFTKKLPEIVFSLFNLNDGINKQRSVKIIPFSVKLFAKLEMVSLPNNELCIRGEKLKNFRLPQDLTWDSQVRSGIAIWFSHCTQIGAYFKRNLCYKKQKMKLEALDWKSIRSLQDLILEYVNQFYI